VVLGLLWPRAPLQPLDWYDQPFYLGIAYDLRHAGRFTDGHMFAKPDDNGQRPPGMRFAPLYPAMLAAAAALDPGFATAMDCEVESEGKNAACSRSAPLARGVQFGMLAGFFLLVWWMGGAVGGSAAIAWAALLLGLATAPVLLRSVNYLMTETTSLLLVTAATAAAIAAVRAAHTARWTLGAGLLLGLATLTRPGFLYLFLAAMATGACLAVRRRGLITALLGFAAGFALPVVPWVVRNWLVLGRAALTFGYDSHTLVQRIAFDAMTSREYALSYLCWLPDGSGLGEQLVGPHACDRFGWNERPDTFYSIGQGALMNQTLMASGGFEHHLGYLLQHYILAEPVKHLLVTIPMALRGAWVDHYWGFVLAPICLIFTARAFRRRDTRFLILALPAWFMLLFNAAVAVNQVRYNLMLIPPFAIAGSLAANPLLARWCRTQVAT
jgi:4-amino-4-deoxy-L-arabinose transferase-like glycosyltransferase